MKRWVLLAALGAVGAVLSFGQQKTAPPPVEQSDQPARISVDVTRVSMLFTVTDKKGRFVTDLGREDFEVVEGKKAQKIARSSRRKATCRCGSASSSIPVTASATASVSSRMPPPSSCAP